MEFGQSLKIVGGAPSLGNWEASTGTVLEWQEGNNWKGATGVEAGSEVEFKLVKVAGEDWSSWEEGENKVLAVPTTAAGVEVICKWGGDISIKVSEAAAATEEKPKKSASSSSSTKAKAPKKAKEEEKAATPLAAAAPAPVVAVAEKEENAAPPKSTAAPAAVAVAERDEKEAVPQEPATVAAPTHSSDTHSTETNGAAAGVAAAAGNDVNLPSEMSSLAHSISLGSDGAMIIEFNSNADGVSAASLAANLKN